MIRLVAGLGNPGREYETTRHNAGYWFADALAAKLGAAFVNEGKFHGLVAKAVGDVRLLKPQTYMNRSGLSIRALMDYVKAPVGQILVVHDELDLPCGVARLKLGGGHGGHNGLRDSITHCGPDFWRLRIGIGHPGVKAEVVNWVLKKPAPDQRTLIEDSIAHSLKAYPAMLAGDMDKATQLVHTTKPPRPKPPRPATAAPQGGVG